MNLFRSYLRVAPSEVPPPALDEAPTTDASPGLAVFGGGCFWCTEAVYREVEGVRRVVSGYAGDDAASADYSTVCSGTTNHAEVIHIEYDRGRTRFGELLRLFFAVAHDPTTMDRQGNDVGRQYRSVVFYRDEEQRRITEAYIRQLDEAQVFAAPIVTKLEPFDVFFEAEAYHQNYAALNPRQPYIAAVAAPKVEKLRRYFGESLRALP